MSPNADPDIFGPARRASHSSLLVSACAAEVAAWRDLVRSCPREIRSRLGLEVESRGALVAFRAPGVKSLLFNRVFVVEGALPQPSDVAHLVEAFARVGVQHFLVQVPAFAASALPPILKQGLTPFTRNWVKFARESGPIQRRASELEIEPATKRTANQLAEVVCAGLDIPREGEPVLAAAALRPQWRAFVARAGDAVVAGGLAFLADGFGHLLGSATRPDHRRRGAQNALLAARLEAIQDAGCRHADTETGELRDDEPNHSYRNILGAGFQEVGIIENYAPPGTTWDFRIHSGR